MQPSDEGAAPGRGGAWLTVPSQHSSPASPIRQPTPLSQSAYACGDLTAAAVAAATSGTGAGGASFAPLSPTAVESSSPSIAAFAESSTARPSPMREFALSSCSSSPRETVVCAEVGKYGSSGGNAARGDASARQRSKGSTGAVAPLTASPADVVSPPPLVPAGAAVVVVEEEPALVHALRVCSSDLVLEASPVVCWSPATPELAALEPLRTMHSLRDSRTSSAVDRAAQEEAYSSHDASRWVSPQAASSASTVASPMADPRPVMASIPSLSLHEASATSSALPSRSVSVLHSRTGSLMYNCAHPRCDSYAAPHAAGVGREERPRGEAESVVQASSGYGPVPAASSSSSSVVASSGARPPRSPLHSHRAGVPLMAPTSLNVVSTTQAVADLHKRQSEHVADTTPTTREAAGGGRRSDSTEVSFVADTIVISPEVTPRKSDRVPMRLTASEEMCATPTASTSLSHHPSQSALTTVQRSWAQVAAVATATSSSMSVAGASSAADAVSAVASPKVNASGGAVPSVPAIRLPVTHGVHVNNNDSDRSLASLPVLGYGPRSTPNACSLTSARSTRSARSARYNNRYGSVGVASAGGGGATAPLPASVPGLKELFPTLPDELYLTRDRFCISQDARHCLGSGAYGTVRQAELYPPGVEAPPLFTPTAEMQSAHNTASIPSTPRFVMTNILSSSHSSSSFAIAGAAASHAGGEGCERAAGSGGPPGATGGAAAPAAATGVAVGSSLEAGGAGYRYQRAPSVFTSENASASNLPLHQQPYSERTASFYNGLDDVMRWGGVTESAARPGASWECEENEGGGGGDMRADAGDDVVEDADESLDVPLSAAQTAASYEKQDEEDRGVSEVRGSWQTRPLAWGGPQHRKCTAITPTDPDSATRIGRGVAGGDDGDDGGRRLPRVLGLNMGYNAVHGAGVNLSLTSQLGGPERQPRLDSECAGGGGCANNSDDDEVESDARREQPRELNRVVCTDDAAFSQRLSMTVEGHSRSGTAYCGRSATAGGVAGNGDSGLPAPVLISRAVCSSDAEDGTVTVGGAAAGDTAADADADGAEHSIASTTGTRTFASSHSPVMQGSTDRCVSARARRLRVAGEAGTTRGVQGEDDEDEGGGSDASNPRGDHSMSYFVTRFAAFSSSAASTTSGGAVSEGEEPLRSPSNSAVPAIQVGALARRVTARPGPRVSFELGGVMDRDSLHTAPATTEARQTPSPTTSTSASGAEGRARVSPVADRLRAGGAPRMPAAFCDPVAMAAYCAESLQSLLTPVTTPVAGQQQARSSRATALRAALSVPLAARGAGADGDYDDGDENAGGQSGKARDGGGNAEATPRGVGEAAARGRSASASRQRSGADALDASRASFFASVSYPAVYTSLRGAGADDGAVAWAAGTVSAELGGAGASFYGGAAGDGTLNMTARHAIAVAMLEAREEYEQHLVSPSPADTEPELEGLEGDSRGRSLSTPSVQYRVSMAPQGDEESGGCSNGGGKGEGVGGVCTSPTSASQTSFPITGPSSVAPIPPASATTSGTSEAARVAQRFTHLCTSRSSATPTSTTTATSTNVSVFHARPSAIGGGDAVGPGIADGPRIPRTPPASWITPASFGAAALAAASGGAAGARGGGGGPAGGAAGPASLPQLLSTAPLPPQPTGTPGAKAEGQQHDCHSTTSQIAGAARRLNTSTNPLQQSFDFPRMPIVRFGGNASMVSDAAANGCAPFRSVATKVIDKTDLAGNAMKLNAFHNELRMASRLHHPCLVNVFGAAEDADHFYLVMDLAEKGNLAEYQKQFGVRDTREMAPRFLADVVLALEYLRDGTQHSYWMPDSATTSAAATAAATRESAAAAGDAVGAAPAFSAAAVRRAMGGGGLTPTSARGALVSKRLALSGSTTLTGLTGGETESSAVALGRPGGEVSFSHVDVLDAVTRRESMSEPSEPTSRTPSVAPDLEPPATSSLLANDAAEPHVEHPPRQRREDEGVERGEDSVAVADSAAAAAAAAPRRLVAPDSIIIHRDLKPDNLLLTWDFHVKLADFGDACFLGDDEANSFGGTPAYISPEMVSRGKAGPYSDLWALGCVLYELLVGERLFPGTMAEVAMAVQRFTSTSLVFPTTPVAAEAEVEGGGAAATALRQLTTTTEQPSQSAKTALQGRLSDAAQDLVRQLLQPTPEERLGAAERGGFAALKAHPFFAEVDWERVLETTNMTTTNTDYTVELAEYLDPEEVVVYCSPVRLLPTTSTTATTDGSMTGGGGGAGGSSKAHSWNSNPAANSQSSLTNHTYSAIASGIGQSVLVMVLTDGPRLFLVNPDLDIVQFEIPWTPGLRVSVQRADRFTITAPLLNGHTPPCSPHLDQPLSGTVGNSAASADIVTYVFADRNRRADLWGVKIHHLQLTESGKMGERSGDGGPSTDASAPLPSTPAAASANMHRCYSTPVLGATAGARPGSVPHLPWFAAPSHFTHQQQQHAQRRGTPTMSPRSGTSLLMRLRTTPRTMRAGSLGALTTSIASEHVASAANTAAGTPCDPRSPALPGSSAELSGYACSNSGTISSSGGMSAARLTQVARARAASFAHGSLVSPTSIFTVSSSSTVATPATTSILVRSPELSQPTPAAPLGFPRISVGSSASTPVTMVTIASSSTGDASRLTPPSSTPTASAVSFAAAAATQAPRHPPHVPIPLHAACPQNVGIAAHPDEPPLLLEPPSHSNLNSGNSSKTKSPLGFSATQREGGVHQAAPGSSQGPPPHPHPPPPPLAFSGASTSAGAISAASLGVSPTSATTFAAGSADSPQSATTLSASQWNSCTLTSLPTATYDEAAAAAVRPTEALASSTRSVQREKASSTPASVAGAALESSCSVVDLPAAQDVRVDGALTAATTMAAAPGDDSFGSNAVMTPQERLRNSDDGTPGPLSTPRCGERGQSLECKEHEGGRGGSVRGGAVGVGRAGSRSAPISPLLVGCDATGTTAAVPPSWAVPRRTSGATTPATSQARQQFQLAQKMKNKP